LRSSERVGEPDALNPLARAGNSSSSSSKGRLHSGSRFAAQGGVDVAPPDFVAVLPMECAHGLKVGAQRFDGSDGQHGKTVFISLTVAYKDLLIAKVDVLHAQAQAIHEPEARAVEQRGHEPEGWIEDIKQAGDFLPAENDGQFARPFGAGELAEVAQVELEDVLVEKHEGVEGLVLGGSGNVAIDSEVAKKSINFGGAQVRRMAFAVKENEAPDPVEVSFFSPQAVMIDPQSVSNLFEQLRLLSGIRGLSRKSD